MKIILTAFEPFNGRNVNNSSLVLDEVSLKNKDILKLKLPVEFIHSFDKLKDNIDSFNPDTIILFGEAPYETNFTLEKEAHNIMNSKTKDNKGITKDNEIIIENEENTLYSTFSLLKIEETAKKFNANLSTSAGTYICNSTYFQALSYTKNKNIKCIFIHVSNKQEKLREMLNSINELLEFLIKD